MKRPRKPRPPAMSERAFQALVIDLAVKLGYLVMHQRPARIRQGWRTAITGHKGFPDLVLARPPATGRDARLIFAELKAENGRPTPEQSRWLEVLRSTGAEAHLWYPDALEAIEIILTRGVPTWTPAPPPT